jgi:hypothetical protein
MAIPEAMFLSVKVKANSQNFSAAVKENKRIGPRWNGLPTLDTLRNFFAVPPGKMKIPCELLPEDSLAG